MPSLSLACKGYLSTYMPTLYVANHYNLLLFQSIPENGGGKIRQGRGTEIGDTHAGTRCVPQDVCWFWGVTFHIKRAKFPRLQASLGEGGGVGDMAYGGAQHADGQGGHARRGFPALQGAWGRAQRGPLAAAS